MDQAEALQNAASDEPDLQDLAGDPTEDETLETEAVADEDTESDDESEDAEVTADDEYEDVEYEGKKYSVPKELKDAVLRQSDYTRKTQEVAETRRALEEQSQQFQQAVEAQQRNMQGHAQLAALQNQLQQYENVDWQAWSQADSQEAQQAFFQFQQLKDAATNLHQQVQQNEAQTLQQQRAMHVQRLEQGKADLAQSIQGWGPELANEIVNHGTEYGFTESELRSVADPRMVKVLNDARMYRKSLQKATSKPQAEPPKPAKRVRGAAPVSKNPDKMSTDEWVRWRNKQLTSR